jgi:hypothetical protein
MTVLISHRGNTSGPNKSLENSPEYIKIAIEKGYDVEVDIWLIGTELHLGHDLPQYQVDKDWLLSNRERIWFHCKNLEILNYFIQEKKDYQFFWHQEDDFTLTSNGYIWTFPGKEVMKNSIIVSLGRENIVHEVYGICSDYVDYLN